MQPITSSCRSLAVLTDSLSVDHLYQRHADAKRYSNVVVFGQQKLVAFTTHSVCFISRRCRSISGRKRITGRRRRRSKQITLKWFPFKTHESLFSLFAGLTEDRLRTFCSVVSRFLSDIVSAFHLCSASWCTTQLRTEAATVAAAHKPTFKEPSLWRTTTL